MKRIWDYLFILHLWLQIFFFMMLMRLAYQRKIRDLRRWSETIAGFGREKQKRFCRVASEGLRNIFLLQQGLPDLADLLGDEKPFYEEMAAKLRKNFSRQALAALDRALLLLERNVNQKILFTDLVNRLYMTAL